MRVTVMRGPSFFLNYQQSGNTSHPSTRMEIPTHQPGPPNPPAETKESPKRAAQPLFCLPQRALHESIDHPQAPCPSHPYTVKINYTSTTVSVKQAANDFGVTQASQSHCWRKCSGVKAGGNVQGFEKKKKDNGLRWFPETTVGYRNSLPHDC